MLLDFTSAFDTIEHTTMHDRLKHLYGLGGTVLKWLKSYLSDRVHIVKVRDSLSDLVTDNCGVIGVQCSIPCTINAPISSIIEAHGLSSMLYADDTQIYVTFRSQD